MRPLPCDIAESRAATNELLAQLRAEVDLAERLADVRLVGDACDMQLWIVRSWHRDITNPAPLEHAERRWFQLHELASVPLADDRYLELLTRALSAGNPVRRSGR
jgi:hypothetical protein